ncbi:PAS domain-containing protein [Candidatus Nitrospira bockiana]
MIQPNAPPRPSGYQDHHYRQLLEAVCNNATVALFIMDERQQCIYMNPAAEQLTGFSQAEVQGRPLHDVIHHTRPDGRPYPLEECPIDRAFPQNNQEQGEEVFVHKDGSFYPVAYTASPLKNREGMFGTIIEVRDIRREKDAERTREELTRALSEKIREYEIAVRELEASKELLEEKINDLERFHDVVVDRELKMIELEREITLLKSEDPSQS